ncbi:thiamine pyrophosphate-dependent enzyme [Streptomyces rugosispiralis]|uniref:Thiamine pyrophosphate-binding protein n=1 Tax=Streptomyces rugosispiralis TaxID=2967341 RepID=A0ABT1UYS4_9ACTN|nr:thiamine pyrophosphate-dependent enzyme [Streptomyces rugosispiralis]MCQ8190270.1 thiamine pyrophosphate-binding protein [Streptomyces rugosispiralis]
MTPQYPARTGGQVLIDQLVRHGVDTLYGVPGESYLAALDALHDAPVRMVVCRHEGGAGYMAEAYGKLTGRPGVCFTTRGPGATNALVALHTAEQDATPLVLFIGLVPRGHTGRRSFQELDLRATFGACTKLVETVDDAARIPEHLARAFATATGGRPGPVVLGLPEDMLTDAVRVADAAPAPAPEGAVSPAQLDCLTDLLASAERPLALLGGSRWTPGARADVRAWAEAWSLPVAVDFRCQDLFDNDSEVYAGALGYGRSDALATRLRDADLLICVGAAPGDVTTDGFTLLPAGGPGPRIVLALPEPGAPGLLRAPGLTLLAAPDAFGRAVRDLAPAGPVAWAALTKEDRAAHLAHRTPVHDDDPLDLGAVFAELDSRLPPDTIVTFGAGNHALWAQRFLTYRDGSRQLAPRNGSMGYGIPAAVAAAIAHPGRQVVSVAGDGCFLMNGQELATAVANGATPLILLVANGTYGTIRQHQEQHYPGRVSGTGLVNPDFAAYARAFGAHGETVTTTEEFAPALERALAVGTAALIELRTEGRLAPGETVATTGPAAHPAQGAPGCPN